MLYIPEPPGSVDDGVRDRMLPDQAQDVSQVRAVLSFSDGALLDVLGRYSRW